MIARWTVEGKDYGPTELSDEFERMHLFPSSYGFFCPRCGRVWATVTIDAYTYHPMTVPCERCPAAVRWDVPGTMSATWNHTFNESMPDALVEREYQLHLALYDTENPHERDTLQDPRDSRNETRRVPAEHEGRSPESYRTGT